MRRNIWREAFGRSWRTHKNFDFTCLDHMVTKWAVGKEVLSSSFHLRPRPNLGLCSLLRLQVAAYFEICICLTITAKYLIKPTSWKQIGSGSVWVGRDGAFIALSQCLCITVLVLLSSFDSVPELCFCAELIEPGGCDLSDPGRLLLMESR